MVRSLCLVVALSLAGCGGDAGGEEPGKAEANKTGAGGDTSSPDGEPVCEAGKQDECPCANGGRGVQVCADDGSKWGECQCEGVKPAPPEEPPSVACDVYERLTHKEANCPVAFPLVAVCPEEYQASGVCILNPEETFSCCPSED